MTQKHFNLVAAVLVRSQTDESMKEKPYNVIRRDIGLSFAVLNPRFDFDKWNTATQWAQK